MTARAIPSMPTWLAGQKLTATLLNQVSTFGNFWADPPTVRMYQSVTQSLANTIDTQITLDASQWDSDTGRVATTPYNYVIPSGFGSNLRFTFSYATAFAASATGSRATYLKKNGTRVTGSTFDIAANNDITIVGGTSSTTVNAGDVIALWAWQNSGGPLNTTISADTSFLEGWLRGTGSP